MRYLSLWILLALGSPAVSTEVAVYKWIDANGVVHYSDSNPGEEGEHQQLTLQPPNLLTSDTLSDFPDLNHDKKDEDRATPTAVLISGSGGAESRDDRETGSDADSIYYPRFYGYYPGGFRHFNDNRNGSQFRLTHKQRCVIFGQCRLKPRSPEIYRPKHKKKRRLLKNSK